LEVAGTRPGAHQAQPPEIDGMGSAVASAIVELGLASWSVPAVVVGVPGLLVLLVVVLQAIGAAAWLPVARRGLRGEKSLSKPRRL
jgi:hypothetical protein